MKGDLNTLKKVCMYASKVMFAGQIVLGIIIATIIVLKIGSLFFDSISELLTGWFRLDTGVPSFLETLLIQTMGFITLRIIHGFMDSIYRDHSPFTNGNVVRLKSLGWTYLISSVFLALLDFVSNSSVSDALFLCLGSLLVSVVMYCLALVFRYGCLLQKESDETL